MKQNTHVTPAPDGTAAMAGTLVSAAIYAGGTTPNLTAATAIR